MPAKQIQPSTPSLFQPVRYGSTQGRWVIFGTVLASGMAFLDGTVVNVALPAIGKDLRADFAAQQWMMDAYLLALSALLLLGGSLADLYGRRRMFLLGLTLFTLASLGCAVAPDSHLLIVGRTLQGVGSALLVPISLAIVSASFAKEDRGRAIGAWSGWSGITTLFGPVLGGWFVDALSWRFVFSLNLPVAIGVWFIAVFRFPEPPAASETQRSIDLPGAMSAALGLGSITYALIEGSMRGWQVVWPALLVGIFAGLIFTWIERKTPTPMVPFALFRERAFRGANATTLLVYFALSGATFLLVLELQNTHHYTALQAGASMVPVTLLLWFLSPIAGRLSDKLGPRLPMTLGPIIAGFGLALFAWAGTGGYLQTVLPAMLIFGVGMALTVAPLTTAALSGLPDEHAGVGSAINNAVARVAGLLAIALLPILAKVWVAFNASGFPTQFQSAMWIAAILCASGGLVAWVMMPARSCENPLL